MGYVYLIRNLENNTYKIGVTKNDPQKRVKQLQTGCSSNLDLLYSFETTYPYRLEKMLHTKFMLHKVEGEWYKQNRQPQISNNVVITVQDLINKYNKEVENSNHSNKHNN